MLVSVVESDYMLSGYCQGEKCCNIVMNHALFKEPSIISPLTNFLCTCLGAVASLAELVILSLLIKNDGRLLRSSSRALSSSP